jgi:geranylgeranyl pyrophosphate synthase
MGMAFQMRDDYLDIIGGDTTKNIFRDVQEGQQTYFTNYIFEKGTDKQQALLKSCMGKELDEKQIKELQYMFKSSGALNFGKEQILNYSQKARKVLAQLEITEAAKASFLGLIGKMEKLEH